MKKRTLVITISVVLVIIVAILAAGCISTSSTSTGGASTGGGTDSSLVTCTVKFNTDGYGSVSTQTVTKGDYLSRPASPSRDGYEFGGWYTSPSYTSSWNFSQPVTSDMILYAKWTAVKPATYSVSFNTGGYGSVSTQTVTKGDYLSRPASPSRDGYEFGGWYTSSSYTTPWDFSQPVTSNMTLYAKWTAPDGTANNPILVSSAADFMKIYSNPSLYYKLTASINLTGYSIPDDVNFSGTLDGNGFTIIGDNNELGPIRLDDTRFKTTKYFGLFSTNSGTIKNLKLEKFNVETEAQDYANLTEGKYYAYFGCVAGLNKGVISDVTLDNCNVKDLRMWGGCGLIAGKNTGKINNCKINGGHLTGNCDIGGVAGVNEGTVRSCSVSGSGNEFISFTENSWVKYTGYNGRSVGGIVGYASSSSLVDSCSVNDIKISYVLKVDACYIGSVVGSNDGRVSGCTASGVSPSMNVCGVSNGTVN